MVVQNGGMGSLADITLGDIGRALGRYRPVAVTVAIILVVIAVLPGPRRAALNALPSGSAAPPASAPADPAVTDPAASDAPAAVPDDASSTFETGSSSSPSSSFDSSSSSFDSSSSDDSSTSSEFSSDFSSSDFGSDFSSSTDGSTPSTRPLTIVEAGWASAGGGTPVGSTGVPEGALPVAKRIGQVDKYSYVRLDGDEKVLTLSVVPNGGRTTTGAVGVSICQITEGDWKEGTNVPSDAAPAYDAATCVAGDPGDGSAWNFNLVTFASPADPRGFALVPTGASIDYQINFSRS